MRWGEPSQLRQGRAGAGGAGAALAGCATGASPLLAGSASFAQDPRAGGGTPILRPSNVGREGGSPQRPAGGAGLGGRASPWPGPHVGMARAGSEKLGRVRALSARPSTAPEASAAPPTSSPTRCRPRSRRSGTGAGAGTMGAVGGGGGVVPRKGSTMVGSARASSARSRAPQGMVKDPQAYWDALAPTYASEVFSSIE